MKIYVKKICKFVKTDTVLVVSIVLAVISMLAVKPDRQYLTYIDLRTLAILFCLMTIVAVFRQEGIFDFIADKVLNKVRNTSSIVLVLVLLCFFMSMIITNDVALITFVPLAIIILDKTDEHMRAKWILNCVAMQTVAANLGSMLTPIGNPQNLFLYGKLNSESANTGVLGFVKLMLPYSIVSLILLIVWVAALKIILEKRSGDRNVKNQSDTGNIRKVYGKTLKNVNKAYLINYSALFLISILAVAHKVHYIIPLILVLLYSVIRNRKVLTKVDYSLLATFVALFVFIGNVGRIPFFSHALMRIIGGRETITAIIASQVISNVPAAILLAGFTDNISALIVGTNIGGLGTLIASMASLISFKYISRDKPDLKKKYFITFTISNIVFLIILVVLYYLSL